MARFYGLVGYAIIDNDVRGLYEEEFVQRPYYGDVVRNARRLENSGGVNDNIAITNEISIVADPYAKENFHAIRYVEWMGSKWKVTNVEVQFPRLKLTLGGVYNA